MIVVAILGVLGIGAWYAVWFRLPRHLVRPARHGAAYWKTRAKFLTPADVGVRFEDVVFDARDGAQLAAWFMPALSGPARGTVIYLHGLGGSRVTTIAGASTFVRNGYNVFAYDSRGSGDSGGEFCTYGFYEKFDVGCAIDYLMQRHAGGCTDVGLLGKSMGGAVALQAAAMDPRIKCVIAEASFTDLASVSRDYQRRMIGTGAEWIHRSALRQAESMARFNVGDVSPLDAVRKCTTPVLFIHGEDDPLINAEYSRMLFAAKIGPRELWLIPRAGHSELRNVAGEEYDRRRVDFFTRYLCPKFASS